MFIQGLNHLPFANPCSGDPLPFRLPRRTAMGDRPRSFACTPKTTVLCFAMENPGRWWCEVAHFAGRTVGIRLPALHRATLIDR